MENKESVISYTTHWITNKSKIHTRTMGKALKGTISVILIFPKMAWSNKHWF
jgi:hypothetical protein